jgi:hypothetical protein
LRATPEGAFGSLFAPSGHQPRRPCCRMRHRGAGPTSRTVA